MTNDEARKVIAVLATKFPGRLTAESVRSWAPEIEEFEMRDALAGVSRHAQTHEHPSVLHLRTSIRFERDERRRRDGTQPGAHLQLVHAASPDAEQEMRSSVAKQIAIDIVGGRVAKDVDWAEEMARRLADART